MTSEQSKGVGAYIRTCLEDTQEIFNSGFPAKLGVWNQRFTSY